MRKVIFNRHHKSLIEFGIQDFFDAVMVKPKEFVSLHSGNHSNSFVHLVYYEPGNVTIRYVCERKQDPIIKGSKISYTEYVTIELFGNNSDIGNVERMLGEIIRR